MMDLPVGIHQTAREEELIGNSHEEETSCSTHSSLTDYASTLDFSLTVSSGCQERNVALFERKEIKIGKFLGKGNFSNVYEVAGIKLKRSFSGGSDSIQRARVSFVNKVKSGKTYAIKSLKNRLPCSKKIAIADLEMEASMLDLLDHENILKIYGRHNISHRKSGDGFFFGRRCDTFFIVTEKLQETLDQRIFSWRVNPIKQDFMIEKCKFALQLANALEYIHEKKIIFRDLKPQNIGFKDRRTIKLFDFGLARKLPTTFPDEDGCFHMSVAGSPRYMAPEVLNMGNYNTKADVYSWTIVFYEMLTLTKPFSRLNFETYKELVCMHGERPEIFSLELPESIESILEMSWTGNIKERYDMSDVCNKMEDILLSMMKKKHQNSESYYTRKSSRIEAKHSDQFISMPRRNTPVARVA